MRPPPEKLRENSTRAFSRKGFVAPLRVFTTEQCAIIAAALAKTSRPEPADWLKGRAVTDRLWYDLGTRPAVLDLVSSILGENVVLWGCSLLKRDPGKIHHWHTDIESSATGDGGFVSVWIGLENTCKETALQFVTGSHLFGTSIQECYHDRGFAREDVTSDHVLSWANEFSPDAEIAQPDLCDGEAVAFDGRVWHASHNSLETGTRLALLLQYARADAPVRIPDFKQLEWPFRFLDDPLPQVIEVCGHVAEGSNRVAPPPAENPKSGGLLFSETHALPLPLPESKERGWRPHHIFRGGTPVLESLSCHMSILSPGHSPHPPHAHEDEELLLVLDGEAELLIADSDKIEGAHAEPLTPGAFVYYPQGQHHTIRNTSTAPVTYLMLKWHAGRAVTERPSVAAVFRHDAPFKREEGRKSRHIVKMPTAYLGRLSAHVTVLQPGAGYDPHVDAYDVVILLLAGSVETIGRRVSAPAVIFYQAGEAHGMRNTGDTPARYLVFEFHPGAAPAKKARAEADAAATPRGEGRQSGQGKTTANDVRRERDAARRDAEALDRYAKTLRTRLQAVLDSGSWKITQPYRFAAGLVLRAITGKPSPPVLLPKRPALSAPAQDKAAVAPRQAVQHKSAETPNKKKRTLAVKLEDKLWGGFSRYALEDLEALKTSQAAAPDDAAHAAWALARWFATHDDHERALENLDFMRTRDAASEADTGWVLLKADCLTRIGQGTSARDLLTGAIRLKPKSVSLCLAMANTFVTPNAQTSPADDEARLGWINRIYERAGLLPLMKADPATLLGFSNLKTADAKDLMPFSGGARVSVIVPAYNAEHSLAVALRGLLAQTWQDLEIVIVDDGSTDETFSIAESFAREDDRIIAIRQKDNAGAYAARNRGLQSVTGAYVTVHDADDWSHPQKIQQQLSHAFASQDINCTNWARVNEDLYFTGTMRKSKSLVSSNLSSTLFPRSVFAEQGGWDPVRIAADTEFIKRFKKRHGEDGWLPPRAVKDIPLSFALDKDDNLTRHDLTSVKTATHGVRREYHEAASHWHTSAPLDALRMDGEPAGRPFPAPLSILPSRGEVHSSDVLFIMDFNLVGGAYISTMNAIRAAIAAGLSVSVFQWRRYDLDVAKSLNREVRNMAHEGKLRILTPGETARTTNVIVFYPVLLRHAVDLFPTLEFDNLIVLVNQMASRLYSGGDVQYDPHVLRRTAKDVFGTEGTWVPISNLVRRLMHEDGRYPKAHVENWTPLVDLNAYAARPPVWRGRERKRPKVGRHGRDHYTKWPSDRAALGAAYCADKPCDVELLGGATHALKTLGTVPENWTVHDFDSMDPLTFVSGLDFLLHYPHEDYVEEFGRAPMEAMAAGVPVILPPAFREVFADAAVYAEPGDVWPAIEALWSNEASYLAQAAAGRTFAAEHCGYDRLAERLARIGTAP